MKCRACTRCSSADARTVWPACVCSSREELREIEPHAGGVQAIHVPQEGIADYPAVCETLAGLVRQAGRGNRHRRARDVACIAMRAAGA